MLSRLVLTDLRNHAALTLSPAANFVVLTGPNGAGKTNVLEAVSLLAPGRGLRRAALSEIARSDGPGGFGVAATLADGVALATGTIPGAPERRVVRVNGAPEPATALAERLAVLWVTPAMDRLFVDAAGARRRFLDRLTLALIPSHAAQAARYEAAMRDRNRLLAAERPDRDWLAAVEAQMVRSGTALHDGRVATVTALDAASRDASDGDLPGAGLLLQGWEGDADALAGALAGGRARDAAAGRALAGPHRSDLLVTHLDKGRPAASASTGEQKALLLGIVLAHAGLVAARRAHPPVLLLDEVAAHLDPARRAALFRRLTGVGQIWTTGTERALFAAVPAAGTTFVAL